MTRNLITGTLITANGTAEQKKHFLPRIARGELMTAAAFTETDVGSDTASIKTRAVRKGDGYLLKGSKMWCTFANRAHVLTVMCRTDPDPQKRHRRFSLLLFEKHPGNDFMPPQLTGEPIPTIGYHGMKSFGLAFDDAYAPGREPDRRRRGARLLPTDGDLRVRANPDRGARGGRGASRL